MEKGTKKQTSFLIVGILAIAIASYNFCVGSSANFNHHYSNPCPHEDKMDFVDCCEFTAKAIVSYKAEFQNFKSVSNVYFKELFELNFKSKFFEKKFTNFNYLSSYNNNLKSIVLVI